jgi:predicted N-acyltransferase
MSAEVLKVEDVREINAESWRRIAADRPLLRLELLRTYAEEPGRGVLIYSLADQDGIVCAAVVETRNGVATAAGLEVLLFGRARALASAIGLCGRRCVGIASPAGQDSGVVLRAAPDAERRAGLERFLAGLESLADRSGMGVAFYAVREDEEPLYGLLCERGYLRGKAPSGTVLPVQWRSFEEYCAVLASRSKRIGGTVRSERRRSREAGVVIRRTASSVEMARALYPLANDHYRYKNNCELPYSAGYLERLLPRLGDNLLLLEAERKGKRCGMLGLVISGSAGSASFLGLDIADLPNDFTYFNLTYYALADYAADLGLTAIHFGNGAYDAKLRRGCVIQPTRFFCRPATRLRRWILAVIFAIHGVWAARKLQ